MYAAVLTEPGHIFSKWKNFLDEALNGKDSNGNYTSTLHWIYDPLVGCALCVSGQMMLWSMLILHFIPEFMQVIDICFLIMLCIGITYFFKNIDSK